MRNTGIVKKKKNDIFTNRCARTTFMFRPSSVFSSLRYENRYLIEIYIYITLKMDFFFVIMLVDS